MLSQDLRLQLSSVDAMLTSGFHWCGITCCCRTELRVWRHRQKRWLKRLCRPSQPLTHAWASSPSVSMCSSFWRSSWGAPRWPPPQDRAVGVPEPSEDISPLAWPGWTHWDHYSPTGKSSYEETCFYWSTTYRRFYQQQLRKSKLYLVDLLELRADVLLLPQILTEAPVRRGKEEFVWMWNTETESARYNRKYAYIMFWKCSLTPGVWHEPWQPPPARTAPPHSLSYLHFYYNKRNMCSYFKRLEYRQFKKRNNAVWL